eukprot:2758267-Prymnesium_polylepis.1
MPTRVSWQGTTPWHVLDPTRRTVFDHFVQPSGMRVALLCFSIDVHIQSQHRQRQLQPVA